MHMYHISHIMQKLFHGLNLFTGKEDTQGRADLITTMRTNIWS